MKDSQGDQVRVNDILAIACMYADEIVQVLAKVTYYSNDRINVIVMPGQVFRVGFEWRISKADGIIIVARGD